MASKKIQNLIVDTSAFIKNAPLQTFGENIFTIQDVVDEITDKRQLRRLVVLPYELEIKDVFQENINFITQFSKKTGDFPSLSLTDIKVLALTYQMEKEKVGTDHLNLEPTINKEISMTSRAPETGDVPGFYFPKKKSQNNEEISNENENSENDDSNKDEENPNKDEENPNKDEENPNKDEENPNESNMISQEEIENIVEELNNFQINDIELEKMDKILAPVIDSENLDNNNVEENDESDGEDDGEWVTSKNFNNSNKELDTKLDDKLAPVNFSENSDDNDEGESDDNDEDESESDEDDNGWITPKNLSNYKKKMEFKTEDEKPIVVSCITSDFAMQNVLKQLGINVISEDGTMIRHLRTFILRCYGCYKTTSKMNKIFCPYCGNKYLKKVAYSLKEDGTQVIHINPRKRISTRGKRFSMPKPQSGQHALNPHLYEDQRFPQQYRTHIARQTINPLDTDYRQGYNPFTMRDILSKSAKLGLKRHELKYWMRKNPNESRRKK